MIPDALPSIITYLDTALTARVSGDLVGFTAGDDWLVVSISGGTEVLRGRVWALSVDFNAYSATRPGAHLLCRTAIYHLQQMIGHYDAALVVTSVGIDTTPTDLTDPLNTQHRYIAALSVYVRPR